MKKYIILILATVFYLTSCQSYLEVEPKTQVSPEDAYKTPMDAQVALYGLYNQMGSYRFVGNYVIAIGDFCSDISVADGSSGHFVTMNTYTFDATSGELASVWAYGYKIINGATTLLSKIDGLIKENPKEKNNLIGIRAQTYAIRAYAYFKMVNIFGLPYGTDNNPHGGLILMDEKPIELYENVSRSSVEQTYALIDKDIKRAKDNFSQASIELTQFYMNEAALYALSARVSLFKKDYAIAIADAGKALELRANKKVSNEDYIGMWKSIAISEEDIFTIAKSNDDNLSANSLNTLYGSYKGKVTETLLGDFEDTDIRKKLFDENKPLKFAGIYGAKAVNNIPQFRVSEMHLILAEAKANTDDLSGATKDLLYTAKRNTAITSESDLPSDKESLLKFIAKERKRELFQEGHRLFDARRTGELINVDNGKYIDYNVSKFVFPIPEGEINSGFKCEQNEGWFNTLPK